VAVWRLEFSSLQRFLHDANGSTHRDAFLSLVVSVADGDAVILKRIRVDGEAVGRTNFIVSRVALADGMLFAALLGG
jgi:hypothetical protein